MRNRTPLLLLWAALALMGCHTPTPCPHRLIASEEAATTADVASLGPPQRVAGEIVVEESWGMDSPSDQLFRGWLGPLQVEYRATNMKGQLITTQAEVALFTAACPGDAVRFRLYSTIRELALWHDKAKDRFIVTTGDPRKLRVFRAAP